ncbi:histidine kinase [Streptomyces sp. NPDC004237]|uniref:sensor histidine kinase n=1 Tax=Streptomyces sp. NPDC004237 TaxID=3154455 RepID=UPI0033A17872
MPRREGRSERGIASVRPRDLSGSLTRQSILVAATTLLVDCLSFSLTSASAYPPMWRWAVLVAIVLVDAGLATAPRLSGVVAVAQAAVAVAGSALLPGNGGPPPQLNSAGLLISAYRAGAWLDTGPAVASLICLAAGTVGGQLLGGGHFEEGRLLLDPMANALLPWLVGRYTTARRAYIAELEQRSEREQRERRQALAEAIAEERSSIAHDLHDVISHHVSAISVHAGVARLKATTSTDAVDVTDSPPASGRGDPLLASLAAVETSSRAAMLDLRRLLDFLHGNASGPSGEDRQPGLDDLAALLDTVRAAGLRARVTVHGVPPELPESLDIAVYRVVQEMLTNALRHGDGRTADVELRYDRSSLTVTTTNPLPAGTRARPDSPHRGLQGIRSRAAMFDGSTGYGPTPDGRAWITTVTFPLSPLDPS